MNPNQVRAEHEQLLASRSLHVPNPKLELAELKARNISCASDLTESLLPYTNIAPEDLDAINDLVNGIENRRLEIAIGSGISYKLWHSGKHGDYTEVTINSQSDGFFFPLTITVVTSHAPEKPEDHSDYCPYSWSEWPTDEYGNSYWAETEDAVYDEEADIWTAPMGKRIYEPECFCDYVEDESRIFRIASDQDVEIFRKFWEGLE